MNATSGSDEKASGHGGGVGRLTDVGGDGPLSSSGTASSTGWL
jgi:hypothetical protein